MSDDIRWAYVGEGTPEEKFEGAITRMFSAADPEDVNCFIRTFGKIATSKFGLVDRSEEALDNLLRLFNHCHVHTGHVVEVEPRTVANYTCPVCGTGDFASDYSDSYSAVICLTCGAKLYLKEVKDA